MGKLRKLIGFLIMLVVVVKPTVIINAQEIETRSSLYISSYTGAIEKTSSGIDIKYIMIARCDKLNVSIELQVYENGDWKTIKTWSVDSTISPFSGKVTYTESVNNDFRTVIAYKAYMSNILVELKSTTVYP